LTKLRVYEYAKELNMSSKEIITILGRLNMPVNNHMSVMETPMVEAVEGFFSEVKSRAATRTAAEQERRVARERERAQAEAKAAQLRAEQEAVKDTEVEELVRTVRIADVGRLEARIVNSAGGQQTLQQEDAAEKRVEAVVTQELPTQVAPAVPVAISPVDEAAEQITGARSTQNANALSDRRPQGQSSQGQRRPQGNPRSDSAYRGDRPDSGRSSSPRTGGDRPNSSGGPDSRPPVRQTSDSRDRPSGPGPESSGGSVPPYGDAVSSGSWSAGGAGGRGWGKGPRVVVGCSSGGYDRRPTGDRPAAGQTGGNRYGGGGAGASGSSGPRYGSGGASSGGGARYGSGGGSSSGGGGFNRSSGGSSSSSSTGRPPSRSSTPSTGGFGSSNSGSRSGSGSRPGGGYSSGSTSGSNRFAPASSDSGRSGGGANAAGGRKRGSGDRSTSNRNFGSDKRENNRKLQGPRSSRHGRSEQTIRAPEGPRQVTIDAAMTVSEFAHFIRREASEVIKKLLFLGVITTINQEIDTDTMALVGTEFGTEVIVQAPRNLEAEEMLHEEVDIATLEHRPPVVTIMGHVDHGKTTLLDTIRQTNVTASEAGGITQHIGAYQVEINHKKITFLDTPGHAAFTTMRARGAQITDITVLVVAADDGVMPQTIEAIDHAKAANVPIIVAINKMDKPGANLERIKQELTEHSLVAEEWGGDTIFVPVSALQKQGIEELLEMILLVAEVGDLKSSQSSRSRGTVIEAQLDRGRGPVATVLVQNGTLKVGDIVVAGNTFGRVRAMVNDRGRRVKEAYASMPVEIVGLSDVPSAGDLFVVYDDERQARQVSERRTSRQRVEELGATSRVTLDDLYKQIQEGEVKDLNLILKADVHGSGEAVLGALQKIEVSGVRIKVIHNGVGAITESDILLASASNAIVLGFNVRPDANTAKMAEAEKVDVRLYRVIYNLVEEIEAALKGMLDPVYKEVVVGRCEIRQLFKVSKVGTIAGAMVLEGKMVRDSEARLLRNGVIVHEGKLDSLKRFKEDAREVATGYECGLTLERFNDIKEGDIVEVFKMEAVKVE